MGNEFFHSLTVKGTRLWRPERATWRGEPMLCVGALINISIYLTCYGAVLYFFILC